MNDEMSIKEKLYFEAVSARNSIHQEELALEKRVFSLDLPGRNEYIKLLKSWEEVKNKRKLAATQVAFAWFSLPRSSRERIKAGFDKTGNKRVFPKKGNLGYPTYKGGDKPHMLNPEQYQMLGETMMHMLKEMGVMPKVQLHNTDIRKDTF